MSGAIASDAEKVREAIAQLASPSLNTITKALNTLIPKTFEPERETLQIEHYPELLINLGKLLDLVNPLSRLIVDPTSRKFTHFQLNVWPVPYNPYANEVYQLIHRSIDANSLLLGTLCLIRNLSFEKSNDTYFAYSNTMLRHLTSLLLISTDTLTECSRYVFDILFNIARKMDVSASTRCLTSFYLEDCTDYRHRFTQLHTYTRIGTMCAHSSRRTSIKLSVSSDMSIETAQEYVFLTHQLLPILHRFLQRAERNGLVRALELCARLCSVRESSEFLSNCPTGFLETVVGLLGASFTSIEQSATEGEKPPPCLAAFNEMADAEVRNGAIETMYALCVTVPALRPRIATVPHCMRMLSRILSLAEKRELSPKLGPLVTLLCQHPDNATKFLAIQHGLFVALSSDDVVAEFFGASYNSLFARNTEPLVAEAIQPAEPINLA